LKQNLFIESLIALGGKKSKNNKHVIDFIAPFLLIRHKPTRIEYTVAKVKIHDEDGNPCVYAYRYYDKGGIKKVFIKIKDGNFKDYEPV